MLTTFATGRLGSKATDIKHEKGNFISFSIAIGGETDSWIECTYPYKGNETPKIFEWLTTGKAVACFGRPYARLWKANGDYPAKASQALRVDRLELLGESKREIEAAQEAPAVEEETTAKKK